MGKILTFYNHKGGVGKTTIAFNIAHMLSSMGNRILLVDLDAQASLSLLFDETTSMGTYEAIQGQKFTPVMAESNIFLLCGNTQLSNLAHEFNKVNDGIKRLSRYLEEVRDDYDYIILDCPPALDFLALSGLYASDYVYVTVKPERLSIQSLPIVKNNMKKLKLLGSKAKIRGTIFNMVKPRGVHYKEILSMLHGTEWNVIAHIPDSTMWDKCIYNQEPIINEANRVKHLMDEMDKILHDIYCINDDENSEAGEMETWGR